MKTKTKIIFKTKKTLLRRDDELSNTNSYYIELLPCQVYS